MKLTKSELFSTAHKDAKAFMTLALFMTYRAAFSSALKIHYISQREQDELAQIQAEIEKAKAEATRLEEENKALEAELEAPKFKPTKVKVHWSESNMFHDCEELDFETFESQARMVAKQNGHVMDNGYTKTKITVFFDGAEEASYECRLDLALGDEVGFKDHMQQMIECKKPEFIAMYHDHIDFAKQIDYSKAA
jgi:hypothetical protein